ncbi:caspase family protein [Curvivirga sp.]|uniref:caspase family protein n=1 Tax=Curvivirga sp. TaxID=2856848 RepID=UPI003B59F3E5
MAFSKSKLLTFVVICGLISACQTVENISNFAQNTIYVEASDAQERGDYSKAYRLYSKIIEDDVSAKFAVADMLFKGMGVKKDEKRAVILYKEVAVSNDLTWSKNAAYWLGNIYEKGSDTLEPDPVEAAKWYTRSLKGDESLASLERLMSMPEVIVALNKEEFHIDPLTKIDSDFSVSIEAYDNQNFEKAFRITRSFSKSGHSLAQYNLYLLHMRGKGTPTNRTLAAGWLYLAAKSGYAHAQYELGKAYFYGELVEYDLIAAANWYKRAANQNHLESLNNYAALLLDNELASKIGEKNFDKNTDLAIKLYQQAAEQGLTISMRNLSDLYFAGKHVEQSYAKGLEYLISAAKSGDQNASQELKKYTSQITLKKSSKDQNGPVILVEKDISEGDDTVKLSGTFKDDSLIAAAFVDGQPIEFDTKNKFNLTRYIPVGKSSIEIVALDEWGNSSSKFIPVERSYGSDVAIRNDLPPISLPKIRSNERDIVAIIIGIENYKNITSATYANNDAKLFYDLAGSIMGAADINKILLLNDHATRTEIKLALKSKLKRMVTKGKTDIVLFYAGHGLGSPNGENAYILPYDVAPELLEDTAINMEDLIGNLSRTGARSVSIFLDTCYSGLSRGTGEQLLEDARPIYISSPSLKTPDNFSIFTASSDTEIASGLKPVKHGIFSYYLMRGISGEADANKNKSISSAELISFLKSNVSREAAYLGREQTPEFHGNSKWQVSLPQ